MYFCLREARGGAGRGTAFFLRGAGRGNFCGQTSTSERGKYNFDCLRMFLMVIPKVPSVLDCIFFCVNTQRYPFLFSSCMAMKDKTDETRISKASNEHSATVSNLP